MNLQTHPCVFATTRCYRAFTRAFRATLTALLLIAAPAAWAQAADETYELSIASQSLQGALVEFSQATDIQVLLPGGSVSAGTAPALQGDYTPTQALDRLLADSGLDYRFTGERTIAVSNQFQSGEEEVLDLEPVTITGQDTLQLEETVLRGEDPLIDGFRAENSSSATNVDAPLIETPATVNVFTSDMLNLLAVRRLDDLLQYVPGAAPGSSGSSATNTFSIRGFQSSTTRGGSLGSRSNSSFIDGERPPARRYHFDRSLFEQVDILKGTSSVLYGAASPGGIVNYQTKRPLFEQTGKLSVFAGSLDTRRASVDLTGSAPGDDRFAYRMIATAQESNQGFTGSNNDESFDNRYILKPMLAFQGKSGTRLDLAYEYSERETTPDPGIVRFADGSFGFNGPSFVGDETFHDSKLHLFTSRLELPLVDSWSLLLAGSYSANEVSALWDTAGTRSSPTQTDLIDRSVIRFDTDFDHQEGRAELRRRHQWGLINNRMTLGVAHREEGYKTQRVQDSFRSSIDPLNPVFTPVATPGPFNREIEWDINETSFYLQNFSTVAENLKVFTGLRYTDVETVFRMDGGKEEALDYSFGAIYNRSDLLNPFFSYSTSLTPQNGTLASGGIVPFSEGEQFEFGLKSEWLDRRMLSTLSLFDIFQTNQLESDPTDRSLSVIVGDQRVRGIELELIGEVTDRFSLIGGYSYLDAEFSESLTVKGNTPANVPTHNFSILARYAYPTELGRWSATLGYVRSVDRQGDNENTYELPDYDKIDLNLRLQTGRFRYGIRLENVLDEEYISGGNGVFVNQGLRRSVFFNMSYNF